MDGRENYLLTFTSSVIVYIGIWTTASMRYEMESQSVSYALDGGGGNGGHLNDGEFA